MKPKGQNRMEKVPTTSGAVARELAAFFKRNGYVRRTNPDRVATEGWRLYKKGYEVRLVANDIAELTRILRLLEMAGFEPGQPFRKSLQYRIPIYGHEKVERFLSLVEHAESSGSSTKK